MSGQTRPTKKERRSEARSQREELLRRRRRKQRTRKIVSFLGAIAVLAGIVGFVTIGGSEDRAGRPPAGVQSFQVTKRNHVEGTLDYPQDPPVGGDHNPVWQNCGFYDSAIVKENGVHSLEHGALWITYSPDLPEEQLQALRDLAGSESFILATPYPGLRSAVVASAWARQLSLDSATDPKLEAFVRAFMVGPTTPEPGAPCTGGIGAPV